MIANKQGISAARPVIGPRIQLRGQRLASNNPFPDVIAYKQIPPLLITYFNGPANALIERIDKSIYARINADATLPIRNITKTFRFESSPSRHASSSACSMISRPQFCQLNDAHPLLSIIRIERKIRLSIFGIVFVIS